MMEPNAKNDYNNKDGFDQETEMMADEIVKYSPEVRPNKNFAKKLQSKILNDFRDLYKINKRNNMNNFNWKILFGYVGGLAVVTLAIFFGIKYSPTNPVFVDNTKIFTVSDAALPKFASCQALTKTIKDNSVKSTSRSGIFDLAIGSATKSTATQSAGNLPAPAAESISSDYSQTNIQVAGVDEADTVKTDGQYIYTISGNNVFVALAYPAADAKLISKISITNGSPSEIFIDGKNLLVFGSRYYSNPSGAEDLKAVTGSGTSSSSGGAATAPSIAPDIYPYYTNLTFVEIYNLADPTKPELKRKLEFEGSYTSSRKIDNYVYFVVNSYPDYRLLQTNTNTVIPPTEIVPMYRDLSGKSLDTPTASLTPMVGCADVSYINPIESNQYVSVIGLPIDNYTKDVTKEVVLGSSDNIYASLKNLYIANTSWAAYDAGFIEKIKGTVPTEKTNIYKFNLNKDKITYQGTTTVPGTILNQYSMDEYNDHFRIATTTGYVAQQNSTATNNLYVLDKDLKLSGSIEKIAPGEKFYSTRFMGDRAYLVTFKKVDPFFTVDLSDPSNPKILGQLKIPGFSDYLHPYDATHIIGIGKDTAESESGDFAWYQGLKLAIFDVTDVSNPKEMWKTIIGDRGTDSPVLTNPKAFLFSKEKNLLVIPVNLAELTDAQKAATVNSEKNAYGQFTFQGSYVYDLTLDKGFVLKGRVTQYANSDTFLKSGYYMTGDYSISRNLYIDNSLYSMSMKQIMINSLTDLAEQGKVNLQQ